MFRKFAGALFVAGTGAVEPLYSGVFDLNVPPATRVAPPSGDADNEGEDSSDFDNCSTISQVSDQSFQALRALSSKPPSQLEVDSAVEALNDRPDLFSRFMPPALQSFQREVLQEMMGEVREILSDRRLLESTQRNMVKRSSPVSETKSVSSTDSPAMVEGDADLRRRWDELCQKYTCSFCLDVLASPVLTNCSHTFCGSCIHSYMDSCRCSDAQVVSKCPLCSDDVGKPTFERVLSNHIDAEVSCFPMTESRAAWEMRKKEYHELCAVERQKKLKEVLQSSGVGSALGSSFDGWWAVCVGALAVLVASLIYLARA